MAQLLIVYDPQNRVSEVPRDVREGLGIKEAILQISDDLEGADIYEVARKLAELLLEQL